MLKKKIQKIPPDPVGLYHSRHICIFLKKPGKKYGLNVLNEKGPFRCFFRKKNVIKFYQCVICDSVSNHNPVSQSLVIFMKVPI